MKISRLYIFWLSILLFCLVNSANAQQKLSFENITTEDGLLSNSTFGIFQDHLGFLWIGMDDGLQRYDGYQCKTYKFDSSDPESILNEVLDSDKNINKYCSNSKNYDKLSD